MPIWLKAAGKWGSILAIIALLITFLKTVIGFIAFLTGAIKILIILVFILLIAGIGFMVVKGLNETRRRKE